MRLRYSTYVTLLCGYVSVLSSVSYFDIIDPNLEMTLYFLYYILSFISLFVIPFLRTASERNGWEIRNGMAVLIAVNLIVMIMANQGHSEQKVATQPGPGYAHTHTQEVK